MTIEFCQMLEHLKVVRDSISEHVLGVWQGRVRAAAARGRRAPCARPQARRVPDLASRLPHRIRGNTYTSLFTDILTLQSRLLKCKTIQPSYKVLDADGLNTGLQ